MSRVLPHLAICCLGWSMPAVAGEPTIDAVLSAARAVAAEQQIPAFSLAVIAGEAHLAHAEGETGKDFEADAHTPFRIGSITKTFTGMAVTLADLEGDLDVDAPLPTTAPLTNPFEEPVTIRQLLEHTAGLGDLSRREWDSNDELTLAEGLAIDPAARTLRWQPGRFHSYSNAGAGVAAWMLENKTGRSWESWMSERLFPGLGMDDASPRAWSSVQVKLPLGFRPDGREAIPYWRMNVAAYAAINASARDMLQLLRFLVSGGQDTNVPYGEPLYQGMRIPLTGWAHRAPLGIGYGAGIYGRISNGRILLGHGGDADGFRSRFGVDLEAGRGYYVNINIDRPRALRRMVGAIERALLADLPELQAPPRFEASTEDLQALAGCYRPVTRRFGPPQEAQTRSVRTSAGSLWLANQELVAVDATRFRKPDEPVATAAFVRHQGVLYLVGEPGNFRRDSSVPCD